MLQRRPKLPKWNLELLSSRRRLLAISKKGKLIRSFNIAFFILVTIDDRSSESPKCANCTVGLKLNANTTKSQLAKGQEAHCKDCVEYLNLKKVTKEKTDAKVRGLLPVFLRFASFVLP